MGTFLWCLPRDVSYRQPSVELPSMIRSLAETLRSDSRVVHVDDHELNDLDVDVLRFFPRIESDASFESVLTGSDALEVLSFERALRFQIRVPKKNQPIHHGFKDVPSDSYWVAWDGVTAIVMWHQLNDDVPMSGGHVVEEILTHAVSEVNGSLLNQACSRGCQNLFTHAVMRLDVDPALRDAHEFINVKSPVDRGPRLLPVSLPFIRNDIDALDSLDLSVMRDAQRFAEMKTVAMRIVDIERLARRELSHLIIHDFEAAQRSMLPFRKKISQRWQNRGSRKFMKQLIAALLLSLANLETLSRQWRELRRNFESELGSVELLFVDDYAEDAAKIESLDLQHLEKAVSHVSESLASTQLVSATIGGTVAGGFAGGLIGAGAAFLG